jgi:transposase-like protein
MKDTSASRRPELEMTETIQQLPKACSDETAAVEFIEAQRWGNTPCCPHCGSVAVYKMLDAKTGERSKRFLWRCREKECHKQFTVRIGTVYEESRIELRHWCYAFWRAATSKKGVAAMEIQRHTGLSYKSSLFLLHRIRFAMAQQPGGPKLRGTVEADETYCGGKPRFGTFGHLRGRGSKKIPVLAVVERGGNVRRQAVATVSAKNVREFLSANVDPSSRLITDELNTYTVIGRPFAGGHDSVRHSRREYARGDVNTNTVESSFAIVKRGLMGIHHAVSPTHLHRYLAHWDFLWNCRKMNDGDRTIAAIRAADGKRLMYRGPIAKAG